MMICQVRFKGEYHPFMGKEPEPPGPDRFMFHGEHNIDRAMMVG